jgi:hypothetical protein
MVYRTSRCSQKPASAAMKYFFIHETVGSDDDVFKNPNPIMIIIIIIIIVYVLACDVLQTSAYGIRTKETMHQKFLLSSCKRRNEIS